MSVMINLERDVGWCIDCICSARDFKYKVIAKSALGALSSTALSNQMEHFRLLKVANRLLRKKLIHVIYLWMFALHALNLQSKWTKCTKCNYFICKFTNRKDNKQLTISWISSSMPATMLCRSVNATIIITSPNKSG